MNNSSKEKVVVMKEDSIDCISDDNLQPLDVSIKTETLDQSESDFVQYRSEFFVIKTESDHDYVASDISNEVNYEFYVGTKQNESNVKNKCPSQLDNRHHDPLDVSTAQIAPKKQLHSKKKRQQNFSFPEVDELVSLVNVNKHLVECKKTDLISLGQKEKVWESIFKKFNTKYNTRRSKEQLKKKWDALKKTSRRTAAGCKRYTNGCEAYIGDGVVGTIYERVLDIIGVSAVGSNASGTEELIDVNTPLINSPQIIDSEQQPGPSSSHSSSIIGGDSDNDGNKCSSKANEQNSVAKSKQNLSLNFSNEVHNEKDVNSVEKIEAYRPKFRKRRPQEYEEFLRKKLQFIDFQKELLQQEFDYKKEHSDAKSTLECKLLEIEIEIKKKQLENLK